MAAIFKMAAITDNYTTKCFYHKVQETYKILHLSAGLLEVSS